MSAEIAAPRPDALGRARAGAVALLVVAVLELCLGGLGAIGGTTLLAALLAAVKVAAMLAWRDLDEVPLVGERVKLGAAGVALGAVLGFVQYATVRPGAVGPASIALIVLTAAATIGGTVAFLDGGRRWFHARDERTVGAWWTALLWLQMLIGALVTVALVAVLIVSPELAELVRGQRTAAPAAGLELSPQLLVGFLALGLGGVVILGAELVAYILAITALTRIRNGLRAAEAPLDGGGHRGRGSSGQAGLHRQDGHGPSGDDPEDPGGNASPPPSGAR